LWTSIQISWSLPRKATVTGAPAAPWTIPVSHEVRDHLRDAVGIEPAVGSPFGGTAQFHVGMQSLQPIDDLVAERQQVGLAGRDR